MRVISDRNGPTMPHRGRFHERPVSIAFQTLFAANRLLARDDTAVSN
jgi:hypothetical protein